MGAPVGEAKQSTVRWGRDGTVYVCCGGRGGGSPITSKRELSVQPGCGTAGWSLVLPKWVGGSLMGPKPDRRKTEKREKGRKPFTWVSRLKARAMEDKGLEKSSS